jgi:CRP-like cAMP-binding protein
MRKVLFLLGQLTDADVEWLGGVGTRRRVPRGEVLIRQGTRIDTVYLVLDGVLAITTGRGVRLAQAVSGDILGEMSLVDAGLTAASAVVEEDALVLAVPRECLVDKLRQDVAFSARFHRALALFLADRMRNAIARMGYGDDAPGVEDAAAQAGAELDDGVLDNVHLAGARFERMLRRLAG